MSEQLPDGWSVTSLDSTLAALIAGQSPNRKDFPARPGEYGILKTTAIDWGRYKPEKNQEILDDFEPNTNHEVKSDDILITKAGPVHRVGVVAHVKSTPPNLLVSGKMTLLRIKENYSSDYIAYALSTEHSQKPLKDGTTGMAASQTNFTHDTLKSIPLFLPDNKNEQHKIASILTSVDVVIENTEAQINKLQDLKKGMMQELLTKGIGHTEFKDSPVGRIPKGWDVVKLETMLADVDTPMRSGPFGSALLKKELAPKGIPFLGIDNVHVEKFANNYKRFVTKVKFQELKRYAVREDDVMITIMGTVGRSCVVPNNVGEALSSKHVWTMTFDKIKYKPELICWQLNYAPWVLAQFKNESQGGVMDSISSKTLKNLLLPHPPIYEQSIIAKNHKSISAVIETKQSKLASLKSLKASLMQDLLTGMVRVKTD